MSMDAFSAAARSSRFPGSQHGRTSLANNFVPRSLTSSGVAPETERDVQLKIAEQPASILEPSEILSASPNLPPS